MGIQFPFKISGSRTSDVMERYNALYGRYKRGQLSRVEKAKFVLIQRSVEKRLQLVEVTPDEANHDLHEQMAGRFEDGKLKGKNKDQVHSFGAENVEQLKKYRLGGRNSNKTAYALIDPETRTVLSAIYVYRSENPVVEGQEPYAHLPNNVHKILHEDLRELGGMPTSLVFFSISRFFKMSGEGELLISKLHKNLNQLYKSHPEITFATLSPFRGFRKWCEEKIDDLQTLKLDFDQAAINCLIEDKSDLVKRFHLSNGASVIKLHKDANAPGSEDQREGLGYMVSYGYSRDPYILLRNAASFAMDKVVERLPDYLLQRLGNSVESLSPHQR